MARTQIARKKPAQPIKREYVMNPAKGLNMLVSESLIDKREASNLLNVSFEESGIVKKRDGFTSAGTESLTNPQGLSYYYSETDKQLLAVANGQPKKYVSGSWTNISGVTLDASRPFIDSTQAAGNTYFWDATSGGVEYNGTTTSRPGKIPKAKFSIYFNGLHLASGVPGQPSRVYIAAGGKPSVFTRDATGKPSGTAVGDGWPDNATDVPGATDFTGTAAAQTIDINKNDGFAVTGLAVFQGKIIILKENAIYEMTFGEGSSVTVTAITKSVGCVSHRTICYVENDIYFLSRRGVFVLGNEENFYTAIRSNELSARIRPLLDQIRESGYELCNAIYHRDQYMLNVPLTSDSINRLIPYDRRYQAWSHWDTLCGISMVNFIDSDNIEHLYFLPDESETILKEMTPGVYTDDGVAINAFWESGALDAAAIDITKRWVDLGLIIRNLNGILTASIYTDGEQLLKETSIGGQAGAEGWGYDMVGDSWVGGTDIPDTGVSERNFVNEPYRLVIKRNSRTVKFRVENNRLNESFAILGYILGYYPYNYYKFSSRNKVY